MHYIPVRTACDVHGYVVFDIDISTEFARPLACRELFGRVMVKRAIAVQRDSLESRFRNTVVAEFEPDSAVRVDERQQSARQRISGNWPIHIGLPPVVGIAGGPRDTAVIASRRASDLVVGRREPRKCRPE